MLQRVAVCCRVLQCVAVCCSVLQCVAVCCSVWQCVAVCCSVLHQVWMQWLAPESLSGVRDSFISGVRDSYTYMHFVILRALASKTHIYIQIGTYLYIYVVLDSFVCICGP